MSKPNFRDLFMLEVTDGAPDVADDNINEGSSEFDSKCPSMNPTVDFDPNATGAKEHSNSIPGGLKETPSAKPDGGEHGVSVPGGLKETPSAKPADARSVSIPSKTTLTADQYNSAISALKKSFKEGYEIMDILEKAEVVHKTTDQLQMEFTENAINAAMLEAYENGPLFEAADRSDKQVLKNLVRKLRGPIEKELSGKCKFHKAAAVVKSVSTSKDTKQAWNSKLWQVLGIINISGNGVKSIVKDLTDSHKDELGEYKILTSKVSGDLKTTLASNLKWEDKSNAYFLVVDKKLPPELKEAEAILGADGASTDDACEDCDSGDNKKECKDDNCDE